MSSAKYFALFLFELFVCGFAQYYDGYSSYPYGYYGNYPVNNNQGYYRSSPCRSSCGNVQPVSYCQHLPCYGQQQSYYAPYYWPYPNSYNSRSYGSNQPYVNYFSNLKSNQQPYINYYRGFSSRKSSDPYADVPVEVIDDESVINHRISSSSKKQDQYFDVPVEIIDDDSVNRIPSTAKKQDRYFDVPVEIIDDDSVQDSWKNIPILPKSTRSSQSNYTVSHGEVTSNSVVQSKPIQATITRSFHPKPEYRIDFLNGEPISKNDISRNAIEENNDSSHPDEESAIRIEETTLAPVEENEVAESESEEVPAIKSWWPTN